MSGQYSRNVLRGMALTAMGRPEGVEEFGTGREAVLGSLIPLIALAGMGSFVGLINGAGLLALRDVFVIAAALSAPLVASHAMARAWGREALWFRYATAFNWCQWVIPFAAIVILFGAAILVMLGLPTEAAGLLVLLVLLGYALWMHWHLARNALRLSGGPAALLVLGMNLATMATVLGPRLLIQALG